MKRLGGSDSLGALISMCPPSGEHSPRSNIYSSEYQSMLDGLDEDGCIEEMGHITEKKRRLSVDQVKALERNFEVENKLEPERKVKLANELGLQPRQVAVWFQNRRARWKTKQLERDYGVLKASFDSLKQNFESLQHDRDNLLQEIKELKSKLNEEENSDTNMCIKQEALVFESDHHEPEPEPEPEPIEPITPPETLSHGSEADAKLFKLKNMFSEFKDGPSDSDSSAILTDDNSPNASNSSNEAIYQQNLLMSPTNSSKFITFNCFSSSSPPSNEGFCFSDSRSYVLNNAYDHNNDNNNINGYCPQFVKIEEHDFFSGEEACNFFSEEQAPSLHWYCADQWN